METKSKQGENIEDVKVSPSSKMQKLAAMYERLLEVEVPKEVGPFPPRTHRNETKVFQAVQAGTHDIMFLLHQSSFDSASTLSNDEYESAPVAWLRHKKEAAVDANERNSKSFFNHEEEGKRKVNAEVSEEEHIKMDGSFFTRLFGGLFHRDQHRRRSKRSVHPVKAPLAA